MLASVRRTNPACGFPAPGFPVGFTSRVMGPIIGLRLDVDPPSQVLQTDGRLYHYAPASLCCRRSANSRAPSLQRHYPPSSLLQAHLPPSRLSAHFPVLPVIGLTLAPPISQRDEEGFSSCSACPCHRAAPTTPPEWTVASVRLRQAMLPSSVCRRLGLRGSFPFEATYGFTYVTAR